MYHTARIKTTKFLLGAYFPPKSGVTETQKVLFAPGKNFNLKVYDKPGIQQKHTILLINGFSAYGYHDPRMMNLAKQFVSISFRAIIPSIEDLEKLRISSTIIDDIALLVQTITNDETLCPEGKISILSPSFSAGMCLIASTNPLLENRIKALCAVGTYAHIQTALEFLLLKQDIDNYGRLIILKNFLPILIENPELMQAIHIAILDNGLKRKKPELPGFLHTAKKDTQTLFNELESNPQYRASLIEQAFSKLQYSNQLLQSLDVTAHAGKIKLPVCLIHGKSDQVIPSTESSRIYAILKENKSDCHLEITPLITHGDAQMRLSIFKDIFKLINAFDFFIQRAES